MESKDIGLSLEQSRGSPFLNNGMAFTILRRFGNSLVVKERFTKYDIEKEKSLILQYRCW